MSEDISVQAEPIAGYLICYGATLGELSGAVNHFAASGFEPVGGPFVAPVASALDARPVPLWAQAVWKRPKGFNAAANGKR